MVKISAINKEMGDFNLTIGRVMKDVNSTTKNENEFERIFNNLLTKSENSSTHLSKCNTPQIGETFLTELKVQQRFDADIKRLAKMMGIGPKMLMSALGDIKPDPQYYDFKVNSMADQSLSEISGYFGVSPMTMMALFEKMGINKDDLSDKKMIGVIMSRIKAFIPLTDRQEKDIYKIIKENNV